MVYDKESWELKIEIRQADIIPEDDDKEKCREYYIKFLVKKNLESMRLN